MAIIEFKNIETQDAFIQAVKAEIQEQTQAEITQAKLKRGLYLLKHGHYWEGI